MKFLNALFKNFSAEQFVTLMSDSCAARLVDPRFGKSVNALFENLSFDKRSALRMRFIVLSRSPFLTSAICFFARVKEPRFM